MRIELVRESQGWRDAAALIRQLVATTDRWTFPEANDVEIASLTTRYRLPEAALFVAREEDIPVGCVGWRRKGSEAAEIKRLFVQPTFRGRGFGRALVEKVMLDIADRGFSRIVLETAEHWPAALAMYRELGFCRCPPYAQPGLSNSIFLSRKI